MTVYLASTDTKARLLKDLKQARNHIKAKKKETKNQRSKRTHVTAALFQFQLTTEPILWKLKSLCDQTIDLLNQHPSPAASTTTDWRQKRIQDITITP
ncbi:hypothetical protein Ciccas_009210 [Cichlidogyrus casuarinus]|uniref:Uncharacterized protein n=1 Tax=Cichlidogyrus casuarinus TaxID=1844966 RepID=A0ABD2PY60_9PLAT